MSADHIATVRAVVQIAADYALLDVPETDNALAALDALAAELEQAKRAQSEMFVDAELVARDLRVRLRAAEARVEELEDGVEEAAEDLIGKNGIPAQQPARVYQKLRDLLAPNSGGEDGLESDNG